MSDRPGDTFVRGDVEVFGHQVRYYSAGDGEDVLVVCPGSAGADGSWAKDMLAATMRVIELNPPGWGGTTPLTHRMDQRDLAVVLAGAIEALGVTRYHLHGASMGGVAALWLAVQFPERMRSLSLEGGMNFVREEHFVSVENIRQLADMVARNDPDGTAYRRAAPHPRKPWSDDAFIRGQMRKRIPMMRMLTNNHETELLARMETFTVPTLALLGDHDELLLPSHLEHWRRLHPAVEAVLVPGAAHDIQNTEPEQLVAALVAHHLKSRP